MRLLLLLCCLLPVAVCAQGKKGGRACRVVFPEAGETAPERLHLHDGTTCREVELPRLNLSRVYQLPGGALTLRMLAAPPAEGRPADAAAPSATVPEATGDFYLVVRPDPANEAVPVRLGVIDAGPGRFRPGQMLWANLTEHAVEGRVGSQALVVKAGATVVLGAPAAAAGPCAVELRFRPGGTGAPRFLCELQWTHDPAVRTVHFIIDDPGSRVPRVLGFPDRRE